MRSICSNHDHLHVCVGFHQKRGDLTITKLQRIIKSNKSEPFGAEKFTHGEACLWQEATKILDFPRQSANTETSPIFIHFCILWGILQLQQQQQPNKSEWLYCNFLSFSSDPRCHTGWLLYLAQRLLKFPECAE